MTNIIKDQVLLYCIDNTVDLINISVFEKLMQNFFKDFNW